MCYRSDFSGKVEEYLKLAALKYAQTGMNFIDW